MNLITPILSETLSSQKTKTRYISNSSNLKVNSILLDVSFKVGDSADGLSWSFLRKFFLTVALRLGTGNGSATNLISSCNLFQLLEYSDYIAGVSMEGTKFVSGKKARISGLVPIGFFSMGSRDSLDCTLNLSDVTILSNENVLDMSVTVSAVYEQDSAVLLTTYQSAIPTGSDQPYTNVLELFYGNVHEFVGGAAVIRDQIGTQNVALEDAIALANAQGRFEYFTRFGRLYHDSFGLSQDLTFKIPVDENSEQTADVLIVGYSFDTDLLVSNSKESDANREALVAQIRENDSEKYTYLQSLNLV